MIGELAALGAAICWTISAVLYKKALANTKPISANIMRLSCTGGILFLFLVAVGKFGVLASLPSYALVLACVSGIIGLGLGDTTYMLSLKLVGVARAVPLTCTYPLFSFMWDSLIFGEYVSFYAMVGAVAIVLGIWSLSGVEETGIVEVERKVLIKGVAFALATAMLWSVSIVMIDKAVTLPETGGLDGALAVNTVRLASVAVLLLISAPLVDRSFGFLRMSRKTVVLLIVGGVMALGLGWFLLAYSFLFTSDVRAVPISSTTPLFSTLLGIAFLHEKASAKSTIGSLMIVGGVFLLFV